MIEASLHQVCILLGSNIQPRQNIPLAIAELQKALEIIDISTTWETPPIGTDGPNFYNTAVLARTSLGVQELISEVLRPIESRLGRVRTSDKYAPRPMDLDVIYFDDQLLEPRIWNLAFITVPVSEVMPDYRHPCYGVSLKQAADVFITNGDLIPHPDLNIH